MVHLAGLINSACGKDHIYAYPREADARLVTCEECRKSIDFQEEAQRQERLRDEFPEGTVVLLSGHFLHGRTQIIALIISTRREYPVAKEIDPLYRLDDKMLVDGKKYRARKLTPDEIIHFIDERVAVYREQFLQSII